MRFVSEFPQVVSIAILHGAIPVIDVTDWLRSDHIRHRALPANGSGPATN